jgi:hypothetical protein
MTLLEEAMKDYQVEDTDKVLDSNYSILAWDMGLGKAQRLSSRVMTPKGWRTMGSLSVGDIVFNGLGDTTRIIATHDFKSKSIYKVTFNDKTEVFCCDEHLWPVRTVKAQIIGSDFKVKTTKELFSDLVTPSGKSKWRIPALQDSLIFEESNITAPPYTLGALLGDGSLKGGVTLHCPDMEVVDVVRKECDRYNLSFKPIFRTDGNIGSFAGVRLSKISKSPKVENVLASELKDLNLYGTVSNTKFIPENYIYSSVDTRKEILAGLLDTDGTISVDGMNIQFNTVSKKMCDGVSDIVRSLGGSVRVSTRLCRYKKNGKTIYTGKTDYRVSIKVMFNPFKLKKKADRYVTPTKYKPNKIIRNIEYVGEEPARCISLESENKWYITDGFNITHNSLVPLRVQEIEGGNLLVVAPPYLCLNWANEIEKWRPDANYRVMRKGKDITFPLDRDIVIVPSSQIDKANKEGLFRWADIVCCDESHYYKGLEAKRTENLHDAIFYNRPSRLILATATPIKNKVVEFYSLLLLCGYTPVSNNGRNVAREYPYFEDFAEKFSYEREKRVKLPRGGVKLVTEYYGLKEERELKKLLVGKFFRRKAKDHLSIKEPTFKDYVASDTNDTKLQKEWEKFEATNSDKINSKTKRLSAEKKVKYTIEYIENLFAEGMDKVVVYSDHVASTEAIAAHFNVPAITGAMESDKRFEIAQKFEAGGYDVLVATLESFSTGVTLTSACNMVLNDLSWIPSTNKQAYGRILRVTQTRPCIIHRVIGSKQDAKIIEKLDEKQKVIDRAVD